MHLHWKYRELVKIIVKATNFEEVKNIALSLESKSGGVLVSVDKVSKGYAIIVFRGNDYKRPSALRPKNLLTKRKALARSIELQRREALLNHISTLHSRMSKLRSEIEHVSTIKDEGGDELFNSLDAAYYTEDEDTEVEENRNRKGRMPTLIRMIAETMKTITWKIQKQSLWTLYHHCNLYLKFYENCSRADHSMSDSVHMLY